MKEVTKLKKYIGKRLLQLIPVLFGITFLSFAMMRAAGSDAVMELYGDKGAVAQEIIDARRAELGAGPAVFHPVSGLASWNIDRGYGNQLCFGKKCV